MSCSFSFIRSHLRTDFSADRDRSKVITPVHLKTPNLFAKSCGYLCDVAEKLFVTKLDKTGKSLFEQGNFAPVSSETEPIINLHTIGKIPDCLNGAFMQVGPNPIHDPVAGIHWFDGDGIVHTVRIKHGVATYVSRFVKTSRLLQEDYYGSSKFFKVGDAQGGLQGLFLTGLFMVRIVLGVLDHTYGMGTANTSIVYHNRKLLVLHEMDNPYVIHMHEDGDIETLGILDYERKLSHPVGAHPKIDPFTGEMFFFCYQTMSSSFIYRIISRDGELQDPVTVKIRNPSVVHDFAITENYTIFMDIPMFIKPANILRDKQKLISFDHSRTTRIGVLPRYAKDDSQIRWFHLPTCSILHTANAWEEGDEVVVVACRASTFDLQDLEVGFNPQLYEFRLNLKNGRATQRGLSKCSVEFPRINPNFLGRKHRYVYASYAHDDVKIQGVIKIDLHKEPEDSEAEDIVTRGNVEGMFVYGPGNSGSEAVFVPKTSSMEEADEDDGYLVSLVYDGSTRMSKLVVIDAKTMAPEPVAVVSIPARVPHGFHTAFIDEKQLHNQI